MGGLVLVQYFKCKISLPSLNNVLNFYTGFLSNKVDIDLEASRSKYVKHQRNNIDLVTIFANCN